MQQRNSPSAAKREDHPQITQITQTKEQSGKSKGICHLALRSLALRPLTFVFRSSILCNLRNLWMILTRRNLSHEKNYRT